MHWYGISGPIITDNYQFVVADTDTVTDTERKKKISRYFFSFRLTTKILLKLQELLKF